MIVASFSAAETARKGEKLQLPNPADALAWSGPTAGEFPKPAIPDHWPLVHTSISGMLSG